MIAFERFGQRYVLTDPAHIDAFRAAGWEEVAPDTQPVDLRAMTKGELIAHAEGLGIKVTGKKDDMIAAIEEALRA